jgi:hypothetical protein
MVRSTSVTTPSLLPFLVAGVLVLLALNLVHLLWEWWGSPTVQIPPYQAAATTPGKPPRRLEAPIFGHNLQFGDASAAATLIVFTDPACAPCRAQVNRALQGVGNQSLRVVYKFWPANPQNTDGGLITEIARREGLTMPFMHALEGQPTAQGSDLLTVLEQAGLPLAKQQDWLKNHTAELADSLNQDIAQGQSLQLGTAPQFILNGYLLSNDSLPPANLGAYVKRINTGEDIIQTNDYWLNPSTN